HVTAVRGLVYERWHYFIPRCNVPGPQPIIPREWGQEWSSCNGLRQSPVLLLPHKSVGITLPMLHFKHFRSPLANPVIQNTGRTLRLRSSMPKPIIKGGILTEEYVFEQAEFHWGQDDHSGSEHIIDGNSYALEAQLLFKLRTPSARVDCKVCPPAFVSVATQFQSTRHRNPELITLLASLDSVAYALDKSRPSLPIRLDALVPNDTDNYYMYDGSRTVPPCSEDVLWLVFRKPSYIGRDQASFKHRTFLCPLPDQVRLLRRLYAFSEDISCNTHLVANLRPLQDMGKTRVLYRTFNEAPSGPRASFIQLIAGILIYTSWIHRP
ncbi:unnamed protein product, partial [Ixodes hexagonus]